MAAALVAFVGCEEADFGVDAADPLGYAQGGAWDIPSITASAVDPIVLDEVETDSVQVANVTIGTLSAGYLANYTLVLEGVEVSTGSTWNASVDDLNTAVSSLYGKGATQREVTAYVYADIITGENSGTATLLQSDEFTLTITPLPVAYDGSQVYYVGSLNSWDDNNKTMIFYPDDPENGIFSLTYGTDADWNGFKMWKSGDFGDWDSAYGCATDGDTSLSGNLTNEGAGSIQLPESGVYYTTTINMSKGTYETVEAENQSPTSLDALYITGGFDSWSASSYALSTTDGHNWYYLGLELDADGYEVKFTTSDWATNWGTGITITEDLYYGTGEQNGSNIVVGTAGTYNVYLNDITGQFAFIETPTVADEYYYCGTLNNWGDDGAAYQAIPFYPVDLEKSTYSLTVVYATDTWNGFKIWPKANLGDWDSIWCTATDGDTSLTGDLVFGNYGSIQLPSGGVVYTTTIDMKNYTYETVEYENQSPDTQELIYITGSFDSWGCSDYGLSTADGHNWYYLGLELSDGDEVKFTISGWGTNWGAGVSIDGTSFGTGVQNGDNIAIATGGTYNVYLNDITGQFFFIAQ